MAERSATMARHAAGDSAPAYRVVPADAMPDEVPSGYKRTEVGVIPADWTVSKIGDLAQIKRGASPRPIADPKWFDVKSDVGWLRISDVAREGKYIKETEQNLSPLGVGRSRLVKSGTLIMSMAATVGRPAINHKTVCIHDGFVVFDKPVISAEFFYYLLLGIEDKWTERGQTGSQINLNTHLIGSTAIPVPRRTDEQHAIATVLSDTDALIESLDRLIAKKRAIKQAAMQQLLTGQTRLPAFTDEWETKQLGDVASIRNQKVAPSKVDPYLPCVELEHIGQGDGRLLDNSVAKNSTSTKYRFFSGDVLFGRLRSYLRKFWLADRDGICTTEIWPLMADNSNLASGFLHGIVQSESFIKAASVAYGTHMPRADWKVIKNYEIQLPGIEEQTAIVATLSDMDAEIQALERRRDKAHRIKQGMMQQLLTGRVRLVEPKAA